MASNFKWSSVETLIVSAFRSYSMVLFVPRRSYRLSNSRFAELMALSSVWASTLETMSTEGMVRGMERKCTADDPGQ